jgi:hypothetical protein
LGRCANRASNSIPLYAAGRGRDVNQFTRRKIFQFFPVQRRMAQAGDGG